MEACRGGSKWPGDLIEWRRPVTPIYHLVAPLGIDPPLEGGGEVKVAEPDGRHSTPLNRSMVAMSRIELDVRRCGPR